MRNGGVTRPKAGISKNNVDPNLGEGPPSRCCPICHLNGTLHSWAMQLSEDGVIFLKSISAVSIEHRLLQH